MAPHSSSINHTLDYNKPNKYLRLFNLTQFPKIPEKSKPYLSILGTALAEETLKKFDDKPSSERAGEAIAEVMLTALKSRRAEEKKKGIEMAKTEARDLVREAGEQEREQKEAYRRARRVQEDVERQQQEEYRGRRERGRQKDSHRSKAVPGEPLRRPLPKPQTPMPRPQPSSPRHEPAPAPKSRNAKPEPTPSLTVHPPTSMLNSPNLHPRMNSAPTPTLASTPAPAFRGFFPQLASPFLFPRQVFGQNASRQVSQHVGSVPQPDHHNHLTRKCWQNPHCPCNENHNCCWCRRCVRTHRFDRS